MAIFYFVAVWIVQVLEVLGSTELLVLIYKVDYAYHSRFSDSQLNSTVDKATRWMLFII